MNIIAITNDTIIAVRDDLAVEPGHRWLLFTNNPTGQALARLLAGGSHAPVVPEGVVIRGDMLEVPHNGQVDRNLVNLTELLTHLRATAPDIIQLTLKL